MVDFLHPKYENSTNNINLVGFFGYSPDMTNIYYLSYILSSMDDRWNRFNTNCENVMGIMETLNLDVDFFLFALTLTL